MKPRTFTLKTYLSLIALLLITSISAQQNTNFVELSPKQSIYKRIALPQKTGATDKLNILFKNKYVQKPHLDLAYDILQKDSFYYVLGTMGMNPKYTFITKFDMFGKIVWQKIDSIFLSIIHYPLPMYYSASPKLAELSDGNMICLYSYTFIDTPNYVYNRTVPVLRVVDTSYSIIKTFVWPDTTEFLPSGGVVADKAGGFTFCGNLGSRTLKWIPPQNGNPGYYIPDSMYLGIVSVDSNMNIVRKKKIIIIHPYIGKIGSNIPEDMLKTHDGGYIVGGEIGDGGGINGWASSTSFVVKFDSLLNRKWTLIFPDSTAQSDDPFNIVPSKDGSYIYTRGHTNPKGIAYGKFDENGNILWEKYFRKTMDTNGLGGIFIIEDRPWGIIEKANGDIIFGSRINRNRATGLVRTDSVGNVKWSRVISTNYGDSLLYYSYIFNLENPIGEGALLVGRVHTKGAFLIRTDSLGCTLPNCLDTNLHVSINEIVELQKQKLIVYPNPAHNQVQVAINKQGESLRQIIIYDINGREVLNRRYNKYLVDIDISKLSKGVYIIKAEGSLGDIETSKFSKQ